MKQERHVGSLNSCINPLQQQAHAQWLELQDAHHGYVESRREQARLQEQLSQKEKSLRDTQVRNIHELGEMKRAQELRVDEFSVQNLREFHDTIQRLTSQLQSMQEQVNSMNDSGEFQEVEVCLTFPVNLWWLQVLVLRQVAIWYMESIWIAGKRFWKWIFYTWFARKSFLRNSSLQITKRDSVSSTSNRHRDLCRKRWRAKWRHNSNADICKKAVDHEFIIPSIPQNSLGWTAKTANFGAAIRQIPYSFIIFVLDDKIQKPSNFFFWLTIGGFVMDQRSGDGRFSAGIKVLAISLWTEFSKLWDAGCKNCFCFEQDHPKSTLQKRGSVWRNRKLRKRIGF